MTRRIGRTLLAILLVIVAAIGLSEWQGWPFLRGPLERTLSKALDRPVAFGDDFELRLFGSIRLASDLFSIGAAEGAPVPEGDRVPEGSFLRATDARLDVPWATALGLLRGQQDQPPVIRSLEVGALELALKREADGRTNWSFGDSEKQGGAPLIPRFEKLVVQDGHIVLDDRMSELQLEASVRTREGSGPGGEGAGKTDPAGSASPDGAAGGLDVEATGSYKQTELKARLHTSGVLPLISPNADAPPLPVTLDLQYGDLSLALDGRASDIMNLTRLEGSYRLEGPSLAALGTITNTTLPSTEAFEIHGTATKHGAVWATKVEGLSLGSSRLAGEFEYDPTAEVPKLTGKLTGERLALADLGPAFGGSTEKKKRTGSARAGGRVLPQQEFELPSLAKMQADVEIELKAADFGTDLLQTLEPLSGRITLKDEVLAISDLHARTAGGEVRGKLGLDAREKLPRWSTELRWAGIRLERFVTARNPMNTEKRDPADGKGPPGYVTGVLGGRAKLQGAGSSTAKMMASLDGSTDLWVTDGTISHLVLELMGIDVAQSLGLVVAGDKDLAMRCAVARFVIKDGLIRPEAAIIDTSDTTVMVDGEVSLADERLALVLTARPKDMSLIALRAPVHVQGSFADPVVKPDTSSIGVRLAGAALLAAINPLASLVALFDPGDPNTQGCAKALSESGAPPGEGQGKGGDKEARGNASEKIDRAAGRGQAKSSSRSSPAKGRGNEPIDTPGVGERYRETPPVKPGVN